MRDSLLFGLASVSFPAPVSKAAYRRKGLLYFSSPMKLVPSPLCKGRHLVGQRLGGCPKLIRVLKKGQEIERANLNSWCSSLNYSQVERMQARQAEDCVLSDDRSLSCPLLVSFAFLQLYIPSRAPAWKEGAPEALSDTTA